MDSTRRHVVVTGATSGIGRALVLLLADSGFDVTVLARSEQLASQVMDEIRLRNAAGRAERVMVDISDLASVRAAAASLLASGRRIDGLINNAAVAGTKSLSRDRFDLTYATNHIGPFLLTSLLLPRLVEAPAARIVNVASNAHFQVRSIRWDGLEQRTAPRLSAYRDYAMTKLMNVLHALELARRLNGTRVTACAVHPGGVASRIYRAVPMPFRWLLTRKLVSNEEGARGPLRCVSDAGLTGRSGRYHDRLREANPSSLAADPALGAELWRRTETAIGEADSSR